MKGDCPNRSLQHQIPKGLLESLPAQSTLLVMAYQWHSCEGLKIHPEGYALLVRRIKLRLQLLLLVRVGRLQRLQIGAGGLRAALRFRRRLPGCLVLGCERCDLLCQAPSLRLGNLHMPPPLAHA